MPPLHGLYGVIKRHFIFFVVKYLNIEGSESRLFHISLINFADNPNCVALSLIIIDGVPLFAIKRQNAFINSIALNPCTTSKCTARVVKQVIKAIQHFFNVC